MILCIHQPFLSSTTDDQSKARLQINKTIELMRECGGDGWWEKAEKKQHYFHGKSLYGLSIYSGFNYSGIVLAFIIYTMVQIATKH